MKVISLKQNKHFNQNIYPIDLIDSSLFYVLKSPTVYPLVDMTLYERRGQREKEIHSVKNVIDFPYEYPFICYATRSISANVAFYTFYRFHLLSKELQEVGTVHYPVEVELEGIFMTDSEVMYSISNHQVDDLDDETTIYLLDSKKQRYYEINDPVFKKSISTPTTFIHKGDLYLLLNPFHAETWEKEDYYRNPQLLSEDAIVHEYIGVISLKQFAKDIKSGVPLSSNIIESKGLDGFLRVIAENIESIFYIRKDFLTKNEELVELNKDTFESNVYRLPRGFSYHSIRIFNDSVYFVSTEEDYFYSPMKKEIFRLEHTYFQHLDNVMNVYVHYLDHRYIVADCWTRSNEEDHFYVAIVDKATRQVQYFEGKSLGCEVYDQTVIIY